MSETEENQQTQPAPDATPEVAPEPTPEPVMASVPEPPASEESPAVEASSEAAGEEAPRRERPQVLRHDKPLASKEGKPLVGGRPEPALKVDRPGDRGGNRAPGDRGPRPQGGPGGDRGPRPQGGDRGPRPQGGDRGGDRGRGPGGRPPFEQLDIELERLVADPLYLDNQAHAVVARMRDMDSGTKSQLRRFYNAVRRACRAAEETRQHEFVMLRARLAYTIARHSLRSLDPLEKLLLQVTRRNEVKGYDRFRDLFEAIIAYNE